MLKKLGAKDPPQSMTVLFTAGCNQSSEIQLVEYADGSCGVLHHGRPVGPLLSADRLGEAIQTLYDELDKIKRRN
jgi:hypothetical protein